MKTVIHNEPVGESEQFIIINRKCQSHLMRRRRWFIGMFSSGISSTARLPRLSSPAIELIGSTRKGRRPLQSFARVEQCKGTGVVVNVDVFETTALGWYLKPRSEEVDASGRAKGNRN